MTEWQVTLDSDNLDNETIPEAAAATPPRRSRWGWLLLIVGIVAFAGFAGLFTLGGQRSEKQSALREDLSDVIFAEEMSRFLGDQDAAVIVSNASQHWKEGYRQTFTKPAGSTNDDKHDFVNTVRLDELLFFDGQCAVVTVTDPASQRVQDPGRAYCLSAQSWIRMPISHLEWEREEKVIEFRNNVQLRFRPHDETFARALVQDLNGFFVAIELLSNQLPRLIESIAFSDLEISIEPHDFHGPLISAQGDLIVINSPEFVATPAEDYASLTGEGAVRLALAKALLNRNNIQNLEPPPNLSEAERIWTAVQTEAAMHILLQSETRQVMLDFWLSQLDGD